MQYIFNAPAYVVFGEDTRFQLGDYLIKYGANKKNDVCTWKKCKSIWFG